MTRVPLHFRFYSRYTHIQVTIDTDSIHMPNVHNVASYQIVPQYPLREWLFIIMLGNDDTSWSSK